MPYLTYDEFKELNKADVDETTFDKLLPKASAILDNVTNYFYARREMISDNPWRVDKFKQALCAQIEYFNELGATTFEGINQAPQSFSAGRTSVTNPSRYNTTGENESKSLVAEDVYIYLSGTGLLFAGVAVW
ncbi:hypothetical protein [Oceanobacillus alkalisoli]|uniref:hypothetical protein n=1 Tax=Oceanobacillus alkalisoli TaxID=2925113 RepID=UPI001F12189B|nr:hypothetical protein [Oceanobacillus alkalisoli]MCF3942207.1 hypothetical protein [Oceanobacillus alkalisoli]